jgi:hypothetical protein
MFELVALNGQEASTAITGRQNVLALPGPHREAPASGATPKEISEQS